MNIPIYFDKPTGDLPLLAGDPQSYILHITNKQYLHILDMLDMPDSEGIKNMLKSMNKAYEQGIFNHDYNALVDYCKQALALRIGSEGEETVYTRLESSGAGWILMPNINLSYWHSSTEIDLLVFANGNIVVIEIKNYHYKTLTFKKDGSVLGFETDSDLSSSNKNVTENLLTQIENHELAVRQCLAKNTSIPPLILNNSIHSILVISNDQQQNTIENETDIPIVKLVMARRTIQNLTTDRILTPEYEHEAMQAIKNNILPDKAFDFLDPIIYTSHLKRYLALLPLDKTED